MLQNKEKSSLDLRHGEKINDSNCKFLNNKKTGLKVISIIADIQPGASKISRRESAMFKTLTEELHQDLVSGQQYGTADDVCTYGLQNSDGVFCVKKN